MAKMSIAIKRKKDKTDFIPAHLDSKKWGKVVKAAVLDEKGDALKDTREIPITTNTFVTTKPLSKEELLAK